MKDFKNEVEIVRQIYNDAWSRNWGFVPMTEEEFDHLAKDLKQIVDPRVVMIAEQVIDGGKRRRSDFFLRFLTSIAREEDQRPFAPVGPAALLWHSRKISSIRVITGGLSNTKTLAWALFWTKYISADRQPAFRPGK